MTRFRKGTTDHDSDGKMGGSLKETDMAKKPTTKAAKAEAVKAAQNAAATAMDPQTGMDTVKAEKPTKAAIERQFKEADAKGDPEQAARDEAMLGLQIRGY